MAQYWAPLVACYLILLLQNLGNDITSGVVIDSEINTVGKIPQCYGPTSDPENCVSLAYAVTGPAEPWIHSVMDYVARGHDFGRDQDMLYLGEIQPKDFNDYLHANVNKTQIGVIFCTEKWETEDGVVIPCKPDSVTDHKLAFYSIVYNTTAYLNSPVGDDYRRSLPKDPIAASLKLWVDNGIIAYFSKDLEATGEEYIDLDPEDETLPRVEVKTQDYPKTHFRFYIGTDVVTAMGGLLFFLPYMIQFVITVMDIMKEKHHKLRQGLSVMGMSVNAYWISWFITSIVSNLILTASTVVAGFLFNYKFFTETPLPIVFTLFFGLGLSLQAVAFALTTLCANMTIAYVSTYSLLLLWVVIELLIGNIMFIPIIFTNDFPIWFLPFKFFLRFMPAFNYSGIFGQITLKSGNHLDLDKNTWVPGPGFTYGDLAKEYDNHVAGVHFSVPSCMTFFWDLIMNIAFYMICTWYFDNVVSHNRGSAKSPLFFLQGLQWNPFRKYENYKRNRKTSACTSDDIQTSDNYTELSPTDKGTTRMMPDRNDFSDSKGLHVSSLNKIYQKSVFRCKNKKDMHAVKDLSLDAYDGELLSILGHNGAGKTTLIGVLTGILNPSSGTAMMCGYDIRYEMDSIRRIMGVCPQFDLLWDELTAEEHLQIFAKLKGVPDNKIPDEIDTRLKEVNLYKYKNAMSGTFSGGMKRRLSMAIAFIGDPRIVFLDEPTTGMDPKNRRHIWELILNMKKNRVVVLTTHAMEEADVLSDRIAVMAGGSLKCIGAPLYLKNTYGDGYKLSVVVEKEHIEDVKAHLRLVVPSGRVLDCSGGSILVGVPLIKTEELQMFLRIMEEKENDELSRKFRSKVKDWGLSHTTLEEVFMKVTRN